MNDQMSYLLAHSVHRDRVEEAERMVALHPYRASHRATIRHAMAVRLHRLADSIDSSRPTRINPSPSR
ncbi:hypothetical protein ACFXJ8_03980 [Nonomuraea sp. NPDC059194]|uniref:hypothetical protein n=1 Tax=Nonomuraea sp. NPDC059194 TaxID=3346764 RepID=UPI0036CAC253